MNQVNDPKDIVITVLVTLFRIGGVLSGMVVVLLGIMFIIGGPDGNAPLESRIIGGLYFLFGLICILCSIAKVRIILQNTVKFIVVYALLTLPLAYMLIKDHDAISRVPGPFIAYACSIVVFVLIKYFTKEKDVYSGT
ncbi:MAG: hypothetical protein ABW080_05930 [Candidatus Thiodiazotropha sp.]